MTSCRNGVSISSASAPGHVLAAVAVGAPRPELEVAAPDLVEHGIGEVVVERDRLLLGVLGVVDLDRLLDRLERPRRG